jgi:predicted ribosome quality control (RQC) complex YloA/Tae2 family protein
MYFDTLTLAAVADELRDRVVGGRVQRVLLLSELALGLEIYKQGQRYQLLASAHPQFARVHLVERKLSRGVEQTTPLLLLLRKYVLGGRIIAIEQPTLERILLLSIVKEPDSGNRELVRGRLEIGDSEIGDSEIGDSEIGDSEIEEDKEDENGEFRIFQSPNLSISQFRIPKYWWRCDLIIEPQDRRSNIILVDDNNVILESIKRVTPRMSKRVIMPRQVYELPPPVEKRDPTKATGSGIEVLRTGKETDLVKAIVSAYRGVSPQAAREAIYRAIGRTTAHLSEELPWYSIASHLRELFSGEWAPGLAVGEDGPVAYGPYALSHLPDPQPRVSMSAALEEFYAAREEFTGHTKRREAVTQAINSGLERLRRQRDQIGGELRKAQELERLRWEGEMIYAFMHELSAGQNALVVEDRTITIDPTRPVAEQAQERFRAYDKAKSALAGLPERMAATEAQISGAEQLLALLAISDDRAQIEQIAEEAEELGYIREQQEGPKRKAKAAKVRPLHLVSSDGFDLYVGRSARQNEEVTFRIGRVDDLWVHVRTIHGAHIIIRSGGREVPEQTLREAAGLAAHFSQARNDAAVEVDIARRSLVRKIPGGPIGLVSYRAERTLRVAPLPPWLPVTQNQGWHGR